MRLACIMTARAGIGLCGCVHDALVIESSIERIDADVAAPKRSCGEPRASFSIQIPTAHYELRTDATIVRYPDRYIDKRGVAMWTEVLALLGSTEINSIERRKFPVRDEDEKRLRELKAAVAAKPKQQTEPFVKMPLWWAEAAAKATGSPVTILLVELCACGGRCTA